MGKYDALFAEDDAKGKKGKYAGLFDEPAPSAPFPWETEATPGRQFSPGAQNYNANVEALIPQKADIGKTVPYSLTDNLASMGRNFVGGAKTLGTIGGEELKSLPGSAASFLSGNGKTDYLTTHPEARRELLRGLSDTTTFGLAEKAGQAVGEATGDPSFSAEQASADAAAAPGARTAGGIAGGFLPSPARALAGEVASAVPGSGALPGAVKSLAQYEATAPLTAAVQAEPGHRLEAATAAATDPAGLIVSGGTGALTGAAARAPERVRERGVESISRGEAGGTANAKLARKAQAKDLYGEIGNDLPLEAAVSVLGKSNPKLLSKMLTKRLDDLAEKTEPIYKKIDEAPDPRFANPDKAPKNGGVDLGLVEKRLEDSMERAKSDGRAFVAESYDKALARLRSLYGEDGKIVPGTKLPSRAMRNFANEVGEGLIPIGAGDAKAFGIAQQAKRALYGDVVGAIEDEGKRVGVDVTELRRLNKKISTFSATRDAYADRAARAEQGHTTLGNLGMGTMLIGGGAAAGGIEGALTGAVLEAGRRLGMKAGRAADFAMAKLVQASRGGAKPAQLGAMALQLGVSADAAHRIARGGLGVLNQPDDATLPIE